MGWANPSHFHHPSKLAELSAKSKATATTNQQQRGDPIPAPTHMALNIYTTKHEIKQCDRINHGQSGDNNRLL